MPPAGAAVGGKRRSSTRARTRAQPRPRRISEGMRRGVSLPSIRRCPTNARPRGRLRARSAPDLAELPSAR